MVIWIVTRACQPGVNISPAGATKRNTGWVGLILGDEEFVGDPWVALASENGLLLDFGCFYCDNCIPSTGDYWILYYWYCYWILYYWYCYWILYYWYLLILYYMDFPEVDHKSHHEATIQKQRWRWTPGSRSLSSYSAQQLGKTMTGGLGVPPNIRKPPWQWVSLKIGRVPKFQWFLEPHVG